MSESLSFYKPLTCNPPTPIRGTLSLTSFSITSVSSAAAQLLLHHVPSFAPNTQQPHISLFSEDEYRLYTSNPKNKSEDIDVSKIYPLGIGERQEVWFIPILWNAGNVWRVKNGFAVKDFHIRLSEKDEHSVDKSIYTVHRLSHINDLEERVEINGVSLPARLDVHILDTLFLSSSLHSDATHKQLQWVLHIISSYPDSERGWLRLADLGYKEQWHKLAMLSYHCAFALSNVTEDVAQRRRDYYVKRIISCGEHTEFGPLLTEGEILFLNTTIASQLIRETLTKPWDPILGLELPEIEVSRTIESRIRYHTLRPVPQELPRFFSWVIPFFLAGMSIPRSQEDVALLHSILGITHILTLTSETPLPASWFPPAGGVRNTFIPVENYYPPTVQQMDRILRLILEEPFCNPDTPGRIMVHCGGGKGRAGTVLACYLALFGFTPPNSPAFNAPCTPPKMAAKQALQVLRKIRAGSVETDKQERFIESYVSTTWKRYGLGEQLVGNGGEVDEPVGGDMEIWGSVDTPDFIVLVGMQGSGKSEFCRLCKLRNQDVTVLSPDAIVGEDGVGSGDAKRACEGAVGRFRKSPSGPSASRKVLILDRCNPTKAERKGWRSLFSAGGKVVAVWFDYTTDLCRARAENRSTHTTLPPHRVKSAIAGTAKLLEPPTVEEGFAGVVRIQSIGNARELANTWFGKVLMKKFIRTRHLLDLGSATRDDLIITAQDLSTCFNMQVVVEEKVDGANLGFSLDADGKILVQNRSHYISSADQAQFAKLDLWLANHEASLYRILARDQVFLERYILYGEWLAATHSIPYTTLPSLFLAFDLYDRLTGAFATRDVLRGMLAGSGIEIVPEIYRGVLEGEDMLLGFLQRESRFAPGVRVEGVLVRWEGTGERGKVVRADFIAGSSHWSRGEYKKNGLAREAEGTSDV